MTDRDTDRRVGAYAPPTDDDDTFDAREDSRRGPLLLTAAFAVFVLFIGVVWSAYRQGIREGGRDAPPRIVADSEPYRERPADPGGEEAPDQDLTVYDRLTGETTEGDGTDARVRPGPEEPSERPGLQIESVDPDAAGSDRVGETPDIRIETPADNPPANTGGPAQIIPDETPDDPVVETPADPDPEPVRTAAVSVPGGEWVVQIGSFRTQQEAEEAWLNFATRYSQLGSGFAPDIQSTEIEGRGTYHRLRISAFASRDSATDYCTRLQSAGQDCYVTRR